MQASSHGNCLAWIWTHGCAARLLPACVAFKQQQALFTLPHLVQGCLRPANNLPSGEVTEDRRRAGHDERLAGLPIPVNYADPIEADLLPAYASEHGKSGVAKPSPEMQITSSTV